jgi:hypothetical protein
MFSNPPLQQRQSYGAFQHERDLYNMSAHNKTLDYSYIKEPEMLLAKNKTEENTQIAMQDKPRYSA